MIADDDLRGLLLDRERLLEKLAPTLRRAGPTHPDRAKVNQQRRVKRLQLRRAIRANAEMIAARCADLLGEPERRTSTRETP